MFTCVNSFVSLVTCQYFLLSLFTCVNILGISVYMCQYFFVSLFTFVNIFRYLCLQVSTCLGISCLHVSMFLGISVYMCQYL